MEFLREVRNRDRVGPRRLASETEAAEGPTGGTGIFLWPSVFLSVQGTGPSGARYSKTKMKPGAPGKGGEAQDGSTVGISEGSRDPRLLGAGI
jgi:hypothetical protein